MNWHQSDSIPPAGLEITLDSMCQHIPDLAEEYEKWTGKKIIAAKLLTVNRQGDDIEVRIENQKRFSGMDNLDETYIKFIFPDIKSLDLASLKIVVGPDEFPIVSDIIETAPFQIGDAVVMPKIQNEFISNLGLLFMVSYVLGMLARYHPSHWIALQSIGPRGHFFPYCTRLIDYVGYSFPRMAADVLSNLDRLK